MSFPARWSSSGAILAAFAARCILFVIEHGTSRTQSIASGTIREIIGVERRFAAPHRGRGEKENPMKRLVWSVLCATVTHISLVACNYERGEFTTEGDGGNAGNGGASSSSANSSSSNGSSSGETTASSSSSGSGGLNPGQCRTTEDCTAPQGQTCYSPGEPLPCGACYEPILPCTTDMECANQPSPSICKKAQCSCGASECLPGCMTAADCAVGEACGQDDHRCKPQTCAASPECPTNFDCQQTQCLRKTCATDAECNGNCVNGQCYDMLGSCLLPPP